MRNENSSTIIPASHGEKSHARFKLVKYVPLIPPVIISKELCSIKTSKLKYIAVDIAPEIKKDNNIMMDYFPSKLFTIYH